MIQELSIPLPRRRARSLSPLRFCSLAEFFGNNHPVEVEIGSGRGNYLTERGKLSPQINFLGVEWKSKLVNVSRKRVEKRELLNVRFIDTNAHEVVTSLPQASISVFHIYFPDPWPKKRHWSRRIVTADFLVQLYVRLRPGGLIEVATDDAHYFSQIKDEVFKSQIDWASVHETVNLRIFSPSVKTLFESKYESMGKPLYYLELKK